MTDKPSSHIKKPGHALVAIAVLLTCSLVILTSGCIYNNKDYGSDAKAPITPSTNNTTNVNGTVITDPGSTALGSKSVITPQDSEKPVVTEPLTVTARPGSSRSKSTIVYAEALDNSTNLNISDVVMGSENVTVSGNATVADGHTITWISSNTSVATIGETNGTIYALAPGNTTISYSINEATTGRTTEKGSREITVLDVAPAGIQLGRGEIGNTTNVTNLASDGNYEYWVNDSCYSSTSADTYGNISDIIVEVGSIINIRATNPLSVNKTLTVAMAHIMNGTAPIGLDLKMARRGTNVMGLVEGTVYQYNITRNGTAAPANDAIWTELTSEGGPVKLDQDLFHLSNDVIFLRLKETDKLPASLHTTLNLTESNFSMDS